MGRRSSTWPPCGTTAWCRRPSPGRLGCRRWAARAPASCCWPSCASGELLLVLDNLEHLPGAAPWLAELLEGCPRLAVLATSRAALRLRAERRLPVGPLAMPTAGGDLSLEEVAASPAVQLFVDRARAVGAVVRAGQRATPGRWPRSVGGWTGSRWRWSWRPPGTAAVGGGAAEPPGASTCRSRAAARSTCRSGSGRCARRSTGATSCSRPRSRCCSVAWPPSPAAGRWRRPRRSAADDPSLRSGQALSEAKGQALHAADDVLDRLQGLIDNSLVQRAVGADGEPRFGMLETVREYAEEQLEDRGELEQRTNSPPRLVRGLGRAGAARADRSRPARLVRPPGRRAGELPRGARLVSTRPGSGPKRGYVWRRRSAATGRSGPPAARGASGSRRRWRTARPRRVRRGRGR